MTLLEIVWLSIKTRGGNLGSDASCGEKANEVSDLCRYSLDGISIVP